VRESEEFNLEYFEFFYTKTMGSCQIIGGLTCWS